MTLPGQTGAYIELRAVDFAFTHPAQLDLGRSYDGVGPGIEMPTASFSSDRARHPDWGLNDGTAFGIIRALF
jgi:hypothetical protein